MSARTCQLCGKPLSRIWVGAGGDFCSREHRNQYRLRLGMDRLQEANKVATLMRRRENLKPVQPVQVESASSLVARAFVQNQAWPRQHLPAHVLLELRPHATARLPADGGSYMPPRPHGASPTAARARRRIFAATRRLAGRSRGVEPARQAAAREHAASRGRKAAAAVERHAGQPPRFRGVSPAQAAGRTGRMRRTRPGRRCVLRELLPASEESGPGGAGGAAAEGLEQQWIPYRQRVAAAG